MVLREDPFIRINALDPFEWSLAKLTNDIDDLLKSAGACEMTACEREQVRLVIEDIRNTGRQA